MQVKFFTVYEDSVPVDKFSVSLRAKSVACTAVSTKPYRRLIFGQLAKMQSRDSFPLAWLQCGETSSEDCNRLGSLFARPIVSGSISRAEASWHVPLNQPFCEQLFSLAFASVDETDIASECSALVESEQLPAPSSPAARFARPRTKSPLQTVQQFFSYLLGSPVEEGDAVEYRARFHVDPSHTMQLSFVATLEEDQGRLTLAADSDFKLAPYAPLLRIVFQCLNSLIAPALPTVPAFTRLDSIPVASIVSRWTSRDDASWVRIDGMASNLGMNSTPSIMSARMTTCLQEKVDGISLFDLFQPAFKHVYHSMTLDDWKSVILQIVITYSVCCGQGGLVLLDSDPMMHIRLCLVEPCQLSCQIGSQRILTPPSRFLIVLSQSAQYALPLGALPRFERFFFLSQYSYRLAQHSRSILMDAVAPQELKDVLVPYAAPVASDLVDTMALLYDLAQSTRRYTKAEHFTDTWSRVKPMLLDMIKDVVVAQAQMIVLAANTVADAKRLIHGSCVLMGGWTLPESWFSLDAGFFEPLVRSWQDKHSLSWWQGKHSLSMSVNNSPTFECAVPHKLQQIHSFPDTIDLWNQHVDAAIRSVSSPTYAKFWRTIPAPLAETLLSEMVRLLDATKETPSMLFSAQAFKQGRQTQRRVSPEETAVSDRSDSQEARSSRQGLSPVKFFQLANAALFLLNMEPWTTDIAFTADSQRVLEPFRHR